MACTSKHKWMWLSKGCSVHSAPCKVLVLNASFRAQRHPTPPALQLQDGPPQTPRRCRPHAPHSLAQQRPLAVQGASGVHALLAGGAARHGVAASGVALAGGAGRDAHKPVQQGGQGAGSTER